MRRTRAIGVVVWLLLDLILTSGSFGVGFTFGIWAVSLWSDNFLWSMLFRFFGGWILPNPTVLLLAFESRLEIALLFAISLVNVGILAGLFSGRPI